MKKIIVTIDGWSSTGKSTLAKQLARALDYIYVDSGAMYRAVTLYCLRKNYIGNAGINIGRIISGLQDINIDFVYNPDIMEYETFLNSENVEREIRSMEVTYSVSRISQIYEIGRAHV